MQEQNLSMSSTQAGVPLGGGTHSSLGGDPTLPTPSFSTQTSSCLGCL